MGLVEPDTDCPCDMVVVGVAAVDTFGLHRVVVVAEIKVASVCVLVVEKVVGNFVQSYNHHVLVCGDHVHVALVRTTDMPVEGNVVC